MEKLKVTEVVAKMVDILEPLLPEERRRVIGASLTLLGDEPTTLQKVSGIADHPENGEAKDRFPPRAQAWMKQHGVSSEEVQQVFHSDGGTVEVIGDVPGTNAKEKVHNAYLMAGISKLLEAGVASFTDKAARDLCKSTGCFDNTNHSKYLGDKGNDFAGSKDKGWVLTAPGLKRGAALVRELTKGEK